MRLNVEPQRATATPGIPTLLGVVVTIRPGAVASQDLPIGGP